MPRRILLIVCVFCVNIFLASRVSFAQNVNASSSLNLGSFTPPPSATPTITDTPPPTPMGATSAPTSLLTSTPTNGSTDPYATAALAYPTNTPASTNDGSSSTSPYSTTPIESVMELTYSLNGTCPNGQVTRDNVSCVYNVPLPYEKANQVIWEIDASAQTFYYLQCVGFVRALTYLADGIIMDNGGNAIDYATNVPSAYYLIPNGYGADPPIPGDLLVWNYDTYGHIAYVIISYDSTNVQIAEANYGAGGLVQTRNVTTDDPNLVGWLRKR